MGAVTSRQIINIIDCFVLSIARLVDRISRDINRKLSTLSSFFFSRVFGYDVVFAQDTCAHAHKSRVGEPLLCQANVCIVPASSLEQRQAERKRRSERRKRAEAAALGEAMLRKHIQAKNGSNSVESWRNSPVTEKRGGKIIMEEKEKVMINLGAVAKPSSPRPVEERETVAERERGKLWVMMGNVQTRQHAQKINFQKVYYTTQPINQNFQEPSSPCSHHTEKSANKMDQQVLQRITSARTIASVVLEPRKSSKRHPFSSEHEAVYKSKIAITI